MQILEAGIFNAAISDSGSIGRVMPWVETRWRIIFVSEKEGIKPVT